MPLETPAKRTAEKILVLTEELRIALQSDKTEEFGGLFQSRQEAIDQLEGMEIDSGSQALLKRVAEAEIELLKQLHMTQASATHELVQMFSKNKNVQAYRPKPGLAGFQRTG